MRLPELGATEWLGIILVLLGLALALWAGPNVDFASIGAAVGVAGALLLVAVGVQERRRRTRVQLEVIEGHRLLSLRGALGAGAFGRTELLATLRTLSREMLGRDLPPMTLQEETRLLDAPAPVFRDWVERQVERLEAES